MTTASCTHAVLFVGGARIEDGTIDDFAARYPLTPEDLAALRAGTSVTGGYPASPWRLVPAQENPALDD